MLPGIAPPEEEMIMCRPLRFAARFCFAVSIAVSLMLSARAQQYPDKTITLVSPYSAGGNADLAARALAQVAPRYLGQPVIVVNRTGAGGIVGSVSVLEANKDGYSLLLGRVGSQAVSPAIDPGTPYKWNSFTIIGMLELEPYVCVVNGKSPIKTFQDLSAALKANPGKMNYASSGTADASVVFPTKIFLNLGLPANAATKVPFRGAADTIAPVLGNHVDFTCNGMAAYAGGLKSGDLRALVVSTRSRLAQAPDAPTASEVGMPDLEVVSGWSALYGPPGLPKEVVDKLVSALSRIKDDSEWLELVRARGAIPSIMSPEETTRFVESQYNAYRTLAPEMNAGK
jgi:tripartite-type tricarboxylate transporter receptor subunit TctC